jgi:hypothetical protein
MIRNARRAAAVAGTAAALALLAPVAANAAQNSSVILTPGSTACVKQYASYQYRATVTSGSPVGTSVALNGSIVNFAWPATAVAYEGRTSFGTFPGAGNYKVCAMNNGPSNTRVTFTLLTDGEFY